MINRFLVDLQKVSHPNQKSQQSGIKFVMAQLIICLKKLVWFYNEMIVDEELKNDFTQIHERSGDNHTTHTK